MLFYSSKEIQKLKKSHTFIILQLKNGENQNKISKRVILPHFTRIQIKTTQNDMVRLKNFFKLKNPVNYEKNFKKYGIFASYQKINEKNHSKRNSLSIVLLK